MNKLKCVSEIENLITQIASGLDCYKGKMSKEHVIEKLKVCLWEIENDKQLAELEAKAAKWDMIECAIKHETRFIECVICGDCTFLAEIDLEELERKYKESE